jgi:alpha/beta hydrolase family protein/VCBS repeat protein
MRACFKKGGFLRSSLPAIAVFAAVIGWNSPSDAYVQQFVVDQTATVNFNPVPVGSSTPGPATSYTIYQGRIFGLLNPTSAFNSGITDISLSSSSGFPSANSNSQAQYIANFQIVTPTNAAQRSGLLIYEVPNRGGSAIPTNALVQGATYVQSGWQGDLLTQCATVNPVPLYPCVNLSAGPYGNLSSSGTFTPPSVGSPAAALGAYVIQVPVATSDGNPAPGYPGNNGDNNTITGPIYGHLLASATSPSGTTAQLVIYGSAYVPYQPAGYSPTNPGGTLSNTGAQFWSESAQSVTGVDVGKTTIPNSQWSFANCPSGPPGTPNPFYICLNTGTFTPSQLYEMTFTVENPLVLGVGFASMRDSVSFLRYGTTAPGGGTNPIAGSVTKAMNIGSSQSGSYIRGSIFYGFNQDESGRIVIDGAWPQIDGRMMWMNQRWAQPNVIPNMYMGGDEAPVWWADFPDQSRNLPAIGLLHRCNATTPNTCPQILEHFGSNEFYDEKMAPDMTGFCVTCTTDIPLPSNVYRYYLPGTSHGGSISASSFTWSAPPTTPISASQTYPSNPNGENYTTNALQADFIQLLMNGTAMPPSVAGVTYPSLASGQLVQPTQSAEGFPNIPRFAFGGSQAWVPFDFNFGPGVNYANESGIPSVEPPTIQQILSEYVPHVNSDGNENVGSVASTLFQAPLGTYVGWNLIPSGPYAGQPVVLAGGYWPFWDTQAHRLASGDPRLSLEERYGTHTGYNCAVAQSTVSAVEQRFLLPSDQQILIADASGSNMLGSGFTPTTADIGVGHNLLCGLSATHDFNGDIMSDVLWRDNQGNVGMWLMNGSAISSTSVLGNVPSVWSIVGQRDFNGDGNADVLWRDTSGNVGMWLMNGNKVVSATVIGDVPTTWSVAGTGDFNGDGMGDILWRDTSGNVGMWLMNGTTIQKSAVIGNVSTNWAIAGADTHGDIFWRNTVTGEVGMWVMNGTTIAKTVDFGAVPLTWSIAGIGDFDGNGSNDILWRDSSGNVGMWLLNGTSIMSTAVLGNVPTNWSLAQTGDYNGDVKSDILWIDNQGNVGSWLMNGTTVSSVGSYGNVGTSWAVQALGAE